MHRLHDVQHREKRGLVGVVAELLVCGGVLIGVCHDEVFLFGVDFPAGLGVVDKNRNRKRKKFENGYFVNLKTETGVAILMFFAPASEAQVIKSFFVKHPVAFFTTIK